MSAAPTTAPSAAPSAHLPESRGLRALVLLVFAVSGAAGLIYELVWMRRLVLIFGSTTLATSTVLAALMGGLALGSVVLGRVVDRRPQAALAIYGLLEVGLALLALAMPLLFRLAEAAYLWAYAPLAGVLQVFVAVQFLLAAAVILPPAALMGGTLPALSRALVARLDDVGGGVGALYAVNTFGAAVGTALATYVLLPAIGLRASQVLAALLSLAAGGVALALDGYLRLRRGPARTESRIPGRTESRMPKRGPEAPPARAAVLLGGIAVSGFVAMIFEVVWSRALGLVQGSSVYAFGTMLILFLAGLAAGSLLFARLRLTPVQAVPAFAAAEAGIALAGLAAVLTIPRLPGLFLRLFPVVGHSFVQQQLVGMMLAGAVLLPAAIGFGVAFPAAAAATVEALPVLGRRVGSVLAWNTAGTVAGAFLAGFVLIPDLGLRAALLLASGGALLAGGAALSAARSGGRRSRRLYAAAAVAAVIVAFLLPAWPRTVLASGVGFYAPLYRTVEEWQTATSGVESLYYKDGISATLSVDRQGEVRYYRVNGKTDASTHPGDMATQLLLGHLPMLLHPAPRDVFVLGLGTGVTARAVARYPVRTIDIVDIEPAAREASRFFEPENGRVLADPRTRLLVADGRNSLLARPQTYDVIISDPSDIWTAGVATLFTREFYQLARARLRPGGVMVQWLHTHALPPAELKLLVATFRRVFPEISIWRPNRGDLILVGTVAPAPWDYARLRRRFAEVPGLADDLRSIGIWHPLAVFSAFVLDAEDIARLLAGVRALHTDDRPVIEYLTPRALYAETTAVNDAGLARLQRRRFPPLAHFDPARDLDGQAVYLLGFGHASLGRTERAIELMEESTQREPANARFLVGLGHQYRSAGRVEFALRAYRQALVLAPAEVEAAVELAALLREQGDVDGARAVLARALQAAPDAPELLQAAGRFFLETGRAPLAVPPLQRAVGRAPQDGALHLLLGQALRAAGRRADALTHLRRAVALLPQDGTAQRALGEVLLEAGMAEEAADAFARAVAAAPRDVEAWVGLARAADRRGDADTARRARERAVRLDPYNPGVIDLFGK